MRNISIGPNYSRLFKSGGFGRAHREASERVLEKFSAVQEVFLKTDSAVENSSLSQGKQLALNEHSARSSGLKSALSIASAATFGFSDLLTDIWAPERAYSGRMDVNEDGTVKYMDAQVLSSKTELSPDVPTRADSLETFSITTHQDGACVYDYTSPTYGGLVSHDRVIEYEGMYFHGQRTIGQNPGRL